MKTKQKLLHMLFALCLILCLENGWSTTTIKKIGVAAIDLPPTVTITSPADGAIFTAGSAISIAATASDPGGVVDSVEFFVDNIRIGVDKVPPYESSYTLFAGNHAIIAKATDDDGMSVYDTVFIYSGNHPPSVSIISPIDGSSFSSGTVISINASASDPDGTIQSVEFSVDGVVIGTSISSPYTATYTTTQGSHSIIAKATDNLGSTTMSAIIFIHVSSTTIQGLENIIVEKYYISNAADAAQADLEIDQYNADNGTSLPHGALPPGSITYRFYADLLPGYQILSVYADGPEINPLKFTTTTTFYNHPLGAMSPLPGTTKSSIRNNLLALDSYFSLGGVAIGQYGVLKTADNGVNNNITSSSNPGGILLNNDPSMGIPLNTQDGMIPHTGVVIPSFIGFQGGTAEAFNDGTTIHNTLDLKDGSIYTVNSTIGPDSLTNKVLIAQVTTNGSLHYELNILIQKESGVGEYYVAKNPADHTIALPFLSGDLINTPVNIPPTVSITTPSNNTDILTGNTIQLTAHAADLDDTVASVVFFVDGVSLGIDAIPPYNITYLVTSGAHVLTAKAIDSKGLETTSHPVNIRGVNSIPNVTLTNPVNNSTYNLNTTIQLVAIANDSLSNVDSVEFFVDGISVGVDKTPPYSLPYIVTAGAHELVAKATNTQGVQGISLPINITGLNVNVTNGLERIYIEKYYVSNPADALQADQESIAHGFPTGALPAGSVTYRFYADMLPDYKLLIVYADSVKNQSLKFKTSTFFYNNPSGLITPVPGISKSMLKNNLLALDTYLSLGGVANGQYGIPKSDDDAVFNNVTTADNAAGVLLNNAPYMVHPLFSRDGMISGSGISTPSFLGFSPEAITAFTDGSILSNELFLSDGAFYTPYPVSGPVSGSNKILIAQITTNGILDYELNLILVKPDGESEYYAANPGTNDYFIPSLIGTLNPDSKPYSIKNTSGFCFESTFCQPIVANENVKDVIGYDIVLSYDKTKAQPTGNITISNQLIQSGYASYAINNNPVAGEVNISLFLNANAPDNTTFNGMGELLCVEFVKDSSVTGADTIPLVIASLQESYSNGVATIATDPGQFVNKRYLLFPGSLQFWTDNSPIKYDPISPNQYLVTNIFGTHPDCSLPSYPPVRPDLNGTFIYNVENGNTLQIARDIPSYKNVQPVINGFDASLGHKVLVNDLSFIPSIFQAIALDVNMDGVISAGDISQLNQRSVKTIDEFKQKWNYDNNGTSNGQPSKDWLFVNDSLLAVPAYKISSSYPLNDGVGYSKFNVPIVPFCLKLPKPMASCIAYEHTKYTGVLLGDVNGNYDAIPNDGEIKRIADNSNDIIYLNLDKATPGYGYIDVPVSFVSSKKIVSLDFAIELNNRTTAFDKIVSSAAYLTDAVAHFSEDDHTLRFTSNSRQHLNQAEAITTIRFSDMNKQLFSGNFDKMIGYLNGEPVNMIVQGSLTTDISTSANTPDINVYPNPAGSILNVWSPEKVTVELMDLQGRRVTGLFIIPANEKQEMNTEHLANGTYLLKVFNDHFVATQRIIIENNR